MHRRSPKVLYHFPVHSFDQADIRRIRAQEQRAKGDAILTEEFGNADNGEGVGGIHNEDVTD